MYGLDTGTGGDKANARTEKLAAGAHLECSDLKVLRVLPTIHGELNMALPREGVVRDGDLHLIRPFIRQLQVVQQEGAVPENEDAITVLWPQVPNYIRSYGLHHGDGFLSGPLHLPLDHRLVGTAAGVADWQKGLSAHRAPHQLGLAGHIHPWNLTCGKKRWWINIQNSNSHSTKLFYLTPNKKDAMMLHLLLQMTNTKLGMSEEP